jgi:hypothetical protein
MQRLDDFENPQAPAPAPAIEAQPATDTTAEKEFLSQQESDAILEEAKRMTSEGRISSIEGLAPPGTFGRETGQRGGRAATIQPPDSGSDIYDAQDITAQQREALGRHQLGQHAAWMSSTPWYGGPNEGPPTPPYPTAGASARYGYEGDQISTDERRMMKQMGVDIPIGMTRSQFSRMFGTSLTRQSGMDPQYLANMSRFADIKERATTLAHERFQEGEKRRSWSAYKVPESVEEEMRSLIKAKRLMKDIGAVRRKFEGEFGPIWGRVNSLLSTLGISSPEYRSAQSKLVHALGAFLTSETGAQRGMTEVRWLETALPRLIDNGASFEAAMKAFEQVVERGMADRHKLYGGKGMGVGHWEPYLQEFGIPFTAGYTPGLAAQSGEVNQTAVNAADQSPAPASITAAPEQSDMQRVYVYRPDGGRQEFEMTPEQQKIYLEKNPGYRVEAIDG